MNSCKSERKKKKSPVGKKKKNQNKQPTEQNLWDQKATKRRQMLHLTINQKNKNTFKIPLDISQNGKTEKSDTTKLFYASEEAGTWGHIHMSCHPH